MVLLKIIFLQLAIRCNKIILRQVAECMFPAAMYFAELVMQLFTGGGVNLLFICNLSIITAPLSLHVSFNFRPSRIPKSNYQSPGMQGLVKVQV